MNKSGWLKAAEDATDETSEEIGDVASAREEIEYRLGYLEGVAGVLRMMRDQTHLTPHLLPEILYELHSG